MIITRAVAVSIQAVSAMLIPAWLTSPAGIEGKQKQSKSSSPKIVIGSSAAFLPEYELASFFFNISAVSIENFSLLAKIMATFKNYRQNIP
jgi:hypothetical protein